MVDGEHNELIAESTVFKKNVSRIVHILNEN